jgi:hypothetical protein
MMQETMEEKRIIMEMYNKDNREKRLKQAHVKTALTKHPLVPRRNKNDNSKLKPGELPLLKDMRKNDNKKDVMPAKDLREKLFRHRIYLRGLKERLNEYRVIDQEAEKFDLHRRIQAYLAAKGKAHKNHTRNISKP